MLEIEEKSIDKFEKQANQVIKLSNFIGSIRDEDLDAMDNN